MYITAQRVVSKSSAIGINTFVHSHNIGKQLRLDNPADVISIAEENTGNLIYKDCAIKPGGNRVKSFLDIIANDGIAEKELSKSLDKFARIISREKMGPIISIINTVGIRFGAETSLYNNLDDEFDTLKKQALLALSQAPK